MPRPPAGECPGRGLPRHAGAYRRVRAGWAARAGLASLLVTGLAAACGGTDSERAGDRAYAEGRFADALGEYRALARGRSGASLWAKVGAAALHANELRESA